MFQNTASEESKLSSLIKRIEKVLQEPVSAV